MNEFDVALDVASRDGWMDRFVDKYVMCICAACADILNLLLKVLSFYIRSELWLGSVEK